MQSDQICLPWLWTAYMSHVWSLELSSYMQLQMQTTETKAIFMAYQKYIQITPPYLELLSVNAGCLAPLGENMYDMRLVFLQSSLTYLSS